MPATVRLVLLVGFLLLAGGANAAREAVKKYGPVTEMKIGDPRFAPQ